MPCRSPPPSAQAPARGHFWSDLAGPFFIAGAGTAFAFIPVSIGALTGITERDAGVASGLLNTSQNLGGSIGVAVASSIAAARFHTLVHHGYATADALTAGFHWAVWVSGLTGLAAIPVAFGLIRRRGSLPREADPQVGLDERGYVHRPHQLAAAQEAGWRS